MSDRTEMSSSISGCEQFVSESPVRMRRAIPDDADLLHHWEYAEHVAPVIGTGPGWTWEQEILVDWQEVWISEVGDRPIGVVVLLDAAADPAHYWDTETQRVSPGTFAIDIWIGERDAIGRGYGTAMMKHAIVRAFEGHGAKRIVIDPLASNKRAIEFYRNLGFVEVGPRSFGNDDCLVLERRAESYSSRFSANGHGVTVDRSASNS